MSEVANINEKIEETVLPPTATAKDSDAPEAAAAASVSATEASDLAETSPKVENIKTPVKRTPSKRRTFIERAQKESEELVKTMGGSLELEGGRRTRSSTRGTPTRVAVVSTPPPAKKARTSPSTAAAAATTPTRARGRGRKIDTAVEPEEEEAKKPAEDMEQAEEEPASTSDKATTSESNDKESVENAENSVVDAANTAAAAEEKSNAVEAVKKPAEEKLPEESASVSKTLDKSDGAPLAAVPEEKQNNVDHDAEEKTPHTEDLPKPESAAMETEVDPTEQQESKTVPPTPIEAVEEASKAEEASTTEEPSTAEEAPVVVSVNDAIEKEPTPEPMEVDSSSKSNDAVETTTIADSVTAEKMDDESSEGAAEKNVAKSESSPVVVAVSEPTKNPEVENNNAATVVENDVKAAAPVEVAKSLVDTPAAAGAEATENNKSENDFCEPKIASPPISTASDGVVSTPQHCN